MARLGDLTSRASESYDLPGFSVRRAARLCCELVTEARRFALPAESRPETGTSGQCHEDLAVELLAAKSLALLSAPLMPAFAARLWRELGFTRPIVERTWEDAPDWVPAGQGLGDLATPCFPGLETVLPDLQGGPP